MFFSSFTGLGLGEEEEFKAQMLIEVQMLNSALPSLFRQTLVMPRSSVTRIILVVCPLSPTNYNLYSRVIVALHPNYS